MTDPSSIIKELATYFICFPLNSLLFFIEAVFLVHLTSGSPSKCERFSSRHDVLPLYTFVSWWWRYWSMKSDKDAGLEEYQEGISGADKFFKCYVLHRVLSQCFLSIYPNETQPVDFKWDIVPLGRAYTMTRSLDLKRKICQSFSAKWCKCDISYIVVDYRPLVMHVLHVALFLSWIHLG